MSKVTYFLPQRLEDVPPVIEPLPVSEACFDFLKACALLDRLMTEKRRQVMEEWGRLTVASADSSVEVTQ